LTFALTLVIIYYSESVTESQEETVLIFLIKSQNCIQEEIMSNSSVTGYDGTIAARLRGLCEYHPRTGKKTTYTTLAEHLGVKNQSVSQWTRSETIPDTKHIVPLADFFGVSCDYLLGRENAPNHAATDICDKTGLAPETVEVLTMYQSGARTDEFFSVDKKSEGYYIVKAIDQLVTNCNLALEAIGIYLLGEFDGLDGKITVKGASINLAEPSEFMRRGFLNSLTDKLMNLRRMTVYNSGELPLTGVLEKTRADRKASFVKQRVEFLEQQRGKALTEAEIQQQADLWEQGQSQRRQEAHNDTDENS
jgi:transcriptional regulator with XRE-family HTH domain